MDFGLGRQQKFLRAQIFLSLRIFFPQKRFPSIRYWVGSCLPGSAAPEYVHFSINFCLINGNIHLNYSYVMCKY